MSTINPKRVFITGGTSGMGLELALLYLRRGHKVAICGRDLSKLSANSIDNQSENQLEKYQVDVTSKEQTAQAIEDFIKKHDGIDIIVANAGFSYPNKSKKPDLERSRKMIHTNVLGVLNTFEPALEQMYKQGSGHLVAVSSVAGYNGLPGVSFYAGSKALVRTICETFNLDLEEYGIHTTCVIPGFVDTPLTQLNPHPMPFMISASDAAEKIYKAIEKKKAQIAFPWQWFIATKALSLLPRFIYRKVMTIKAFNFSSAGNKS